MCHTREIAVLSVLTLFLSGSGHASAQPIRGAVRGGGGPTFLYIPNTYSQPPVSSYMGYGYPNYYGGYGGYGFVPVIQYQYAPLSRAEIYNLYAHMNNPFNSGFLLQPPPNTPADTSHSKTESPGHAESEKEKVKEKEKEK